MCSLGYTYDRLKHHKPLQSVGIFQEQLNRHDFSQGGTSTPVFDTFNEKVHM